MKGFILNVQKQEWHYYTRYLIYNKQGSVQLEIAHNRWLRSFTALILELYVVEEGRNFGLAGALLDKAEEIAASLGHKVVALEFKLKRYDTPQWAFDWFKRRGYKAWYSTKMYKQLETNYNNSQEIE